MNTETARLIMIGVVMVCAVMAAILLVMPYIAEQHNNPKKKVRPYGVSLPLFATLVLIVTLAVLALLSVLALSTV